MEKISPVLRDLFVIRREISLLGLLVLAAFMVVKTYGVDDPESKVWAGVLAVQALPYLATFFMALLPKRSPSAKDTPNLLPQNVLGLESL